MGLYRQHLCVYVIKCKDMFVKEKKCIQQGQLCNVFMMYENQKKRRRQKKIKEHTSELQSRIRISYAVFCLKKKNIGIQKQFSNYYKKKKRKIEQKEKENSKDHETINPNKDSPNLNT
eukprot:TRINITY_DN2213_c0_g2_i2.p5 TRINITY_DN2213_c0_g2~~TRINITY_DN2213_c0_g2_i2.p5  ORF type:complete len:118 (-),score=11.55 TRINITY_DN2213_c0_g2_i2:110-463(-)